jgi:hypothetical protein
MIEKIIQDFLRAKLDVPIYFERPPDTSGDFCVLEKTSSGRTNKINRATFAVQSYADSLYNAAKLNERVKVAMDTLPELVDIGRTALNSDYNFTDTRKAGYRYQAVYDVTYF